MTRNARFQRNMLAFQLVFMITLALGMPYSTLSQSEAVWSAPYVVGEGWWQSLTVDNMGVAHIVWYGLKNDNDALSYRSIFPDGSSSEENDIFYMALELAQY